MINPKGHTADELRAVGYTVNDAIRDGYSINNSDDRFLVAYKGAWPDTDEFMFMHREPSVDDKLKAIKDIIDKLDDRVKFLEHWRRRIIGQVGT